MTVELSLFYLVIAAFLILANAFFVATEFALVKIRPTRLDEMVTMGFRNAPRAREMVRNLNAYLSACQLGVTIASLGLGWIGEAAFAHLLEKFFGLFGLQHQAAVHSVAVVLAFASISLLHVVLGELAPKSLAIQYTEDVALTCSWPLSVFYGCARPFITFLNVCGFWVLRTLGLPPPSAKTHAHSPEEIRLLLQDSHESGTLTHDARELLENAVDFSDRTVRQIMRPRGEIVYLSLQDNLADNLERARKNGYTRYPLCQDDVDHVIGIVHTKDLLWPTHELKTSEDLIKIKREILFVPEMIGIPGLLTEMRRKKILMAIAVDEYGVVSGIATMEDILEELVGEIQDEFDQENPEIRQTKDGGFLVEGTVLIEDLNRRLLLNIQDKANDTVSGHVLSRLGRMANAGDSLAIEHYLVRMVEVRGHRITRLLFTPRVLRPTDGTTGAEAGVTATPSPGSSPGGDSFPSKSQAN